MSLGGGYQRFSCGFWLIQFWCLPPPSILWPLPHYIETLGPLPLPGDGWAAPWCGGGGEVVQEHSQLLFSILLPLFNPVDANPAIMEINHWLSAAVEMLGLQLYQLTGGCCWFISPQTERRRVRNVQMHLHVITPREHGAYTHGKTGNI